MFEQWVHKPRLQQALYTRVSIAICSSSSSRYLLWDCVYCRYRVCILSGLCLVLHEIFIAKTKSERDWFPVYVFLRCQSSDEVNNFGFIDWVLSKGVRTGAQTSKRHSLRYLFSTVDIKGIYSQIQFFGDYIFKPALRFFIGENIQWNFNI